MQFKLFSGKVTDFELFPSAKVIVSALPAGRKFGGGLNPPSEFRDASGRVLRLSHNPVTASELPAATEPATA